VQISGSTVLLTGASGGLGHAIARALAERGARLLLSGRRVEALEKLGGELDARWIAVDLAERSQLERLTREAGEIDILVANAGVPAAGTLESFSVEEIDRALDVNLRAPILLAHALTPGMVARRRGHALFMSSLAGKVATPRTALYNATKYGLRGFAAALRADLRDSGVGVSTLFPGFISDAGMFADAGVSLPPGVGTRSPAQVAHAVTRAIERNSAEVDVAPLPLRAGTAFAGVAPGLAAGLARRFGSERLARELQAAQLAKR
jgi:short-subunit dehydrogenase